MQTVEFKFHGRDEVINIINTGGNLVEYLTTQKAECPLIGTNIKFLKVLGKGAADAPAWLIDVPSTGRREYVAKVFTDKLGYISLEKLMENVSVKTEGNSATLSNIAKASENLFDVPAETTIYVNGGNPNRVYKLDDTFFIMDTAGKCKLTKQKSYNRFDGKGKTTIPENSYLCTNERFSEYVIGVTCGILYRSGRSIHFIDMFGFASCEYATMGEIKEYVFMDKIDSTLKKMLYKTVKVPVQYVTKTKSGRKEYEMGEEEHSMPILDSFLLTKKHFFHGKEYTELDILCVQTLIGIAVMQQYGIQHNDLHLDNVFLEKVTDQTKYEGKKLFGSKLIEKVRMHTPGRKEHAWSYDISGKTMYIPQTSWLTKIGDFGMSVKFSKPIIGNKEILETGYDQGDGDGPWMANWFSPAYDCLFFLGAVNRASDSKFIKALFATALGLPSNTSANILETAKWEAINPDNGRPRMDTLEKYRKSANPLNLIKSDVMKDFYIKPDATYIVNLATLL